MGYDRGDSFPIEFEKNRFPFGSKSEGKPSPRSYPIQFESNRNIVFSVHAPRGCSSSQCAERRQGCQDRSPPIDEQCAAGQRTGLGSGKRASRGVPKLARYSSQIYKCIYIQIYSAKYTYIQYVALLSLILADYRSLCLVLVYYGKEGQLETQCLPH